MQILPQEIQLHIFNYLNDYDQFMFLQSHRTSFVGSRVKIDHMWAYFAKFDYLNCII